MKNGSFVSRVYGRPVNERDGDGWKPIDTSLSDQGDGSLLADLGEGSLRLPSSLSGGGEVKLRRGSDWISLALRGGGGGAPTVAGDSATYADVASGVSARLSADTTGLKEDLVLAGASSQSSFTYDVALSGGLSLSPRTDGGVDVVNGGGDVVFALPAPLAADASGDVAGGSDAKMTVDGSTITVSLSPSWLSAPGRAFPVTLDPSAVMDAARDCYLDGQNTTTSYCSAADLWAGSSSGHDHKALVYFNVAGTVPAAAFVQQAQLHLYPNYQTSPGTAKTLSAHRVAADWDGSATWTKRTSTLNWATGGGDIDPAKLDSQPVPASGTWSDFTVTSLVTGWLSGLTANQGIAITDDGSAADNSVVYASIDGPNSSHNPWLEIEYYPRTGDKSNYTILSQKLSARQSLGVNVAGGNLMLSSADLQVASTGLPVSIQRYYNSGDPWSGLMGSKGRLGIGNDIALYSCDAQGSRCLVGGGDIRERFTRNADGSFNTPVGLGNVTLKRAAPTSGRFTLTDNGSGVEYGFFDNDFSYMDSLKDRHGNQLTLEYHGTGNALSKITDQRGRSYNVTTNAAGFITKISVPTTVIAGGADWNYAYANNDDLLTSVTDPEGNVTTYTYTTDGYDLLTKIHDARGNDTTIDYDAEKRVSAVTRVIDGTTANDVKTTYVYSTTLGANCTGVAKVIGQTIVTDPNNHATTYCWDQDGEVVRAKDAKGNTVANEYNQQGNSTKFSSYYGGTSALGSFTTNYDPTGQNPTDVTDAAGATTVFGYPSSPTTAAQAAHPTSVTESNRNGASGTPGAKNVTNFSYDSEFNVTQVQSNATTLKATLTYNADGQIATAKDGNNNVTTYGYDPTTHELTTVTPQPLTPAGIGATTYTYDGLSRVKKITWGNAKWISYTYDRLGQITGITDSDGQTTTLVFDGDGNITSRTTGTQVSSYGYDKLNRKTSESFPGSVTNTYAYDKAGNLASLTDPSGTTTYTYDPVNRTATIVSPTATTGTDTTTFTYNDPGSAGADATHGNVVEGLPGGGSIKTTADLAGKMTDLLVKNSSSAQTMHRSWTYSINIAGGSTPTSGELADQAIDYGTGTTPVTTTSYYYGDNDQLLEAQTVNGTGGSNVADYVNSYDPAGNRTKKVVTTGAGSPATTSYAYNGDNELCWLYSGTSANGCGTPPTGATVYAYDGAGNRTTDGAANLTWDARGRLASLAGSSVTHLSPTNNELTAIGASSFQNNALGVGRATVASNLTKLVRDPGNGATTSLIASSTKRWLVTDQLGSTIALVDGSGVVQRSYTYDPDGNLTANTGSGPESPIKFAGGHDVGNGLYHFGDRYYQPATGRWTQPDFLDQAGDLGQMNSYIYVGNNPINSIDPSGRFSVGISGDIGGLGVGIEVDTHGHVAGSVGVGKSFGGSTHLLAHSGDVAETGKDVSAHACVGEGAVVCGSKSLTKKGGWGYGVGIGSTGGGISAEEHKRFF